MDAILILKVIVLFWVLFQTTKKINDIEESDIFNSVLLRTIVQQLNEKKILMKQDVIKSERQIRRLRDNFDSEWFEDKIELFD